MYIVSRTSAVWVEDTAPRALAPADAPLADFQVGPGIRWAARPLRLPHLICLGLRSSDGVLLVYVSRKGKREWLPASGVLRESELRRWFECDFVRLPTR